MLKYFFTLFLCSWFSGINEIRENKNPVKLNEFTLLAVPLRQPSVWGGGNRPLKLSLHYFMFICTDTTLVVSTPLLTNYMYLVEVKHV